MRLYIVMFLVGVMLCGWSGQALALSADDVKAYKKADGTELMVVVQHPLKKIVSARRDYIRYIEIQLDSAKPVVQSFTFQRGPRQTANFPVSGLEKTKSIRVKATPSSGAPGEITITPAELLPYPTK